MGADSVLSVLANSILQTSTWPPVFIRVVDRMGPGTPFGTRRGAPEGIVCQLFISHGLIIYYYWWNYFSLKKEEIGWLYLLLLKGLLIRVVPDGLDLVQAVNNCLDYFCSSS